MYRNLKYVLYHGTIATIEKIDINQGKGRKDFGKGFYMAVSRSQAIGMMHKKYKEAVRRSRNKRASDFTEHLYQIGEYLRVIGAAGISKEDKRLHPTATGMLMFGNEYDIVRYFPEYFFDYRENPDTVIRWTDRLQSSSGEWSGNLFSVYWG